MNIPQASYYRNLNNYYKYKSNLSVSQYSCVNAAVKPISQFSSSYDELELPFKIQGRLVSVGEYSEGGFDRKVSLTADALKPTTVDWEGVLIYTSHDAYRKVLNGEPVSTDEVIGKIIKTTWNDEDPGIDFVAEIHDRRIAYKMAHGLISFISVGFARRVVSSKGKYYYMDIEPKEASTVFEPRDKKAIFKPL